MKTKNQRVSSNIIDKRPGAKGPSALKERLGSNSARQIFDPEYSKGLTKAANTMANRHRDTLMGRGKAKGAAQMKSSAPPTSPKPSPSVANKIQNLPRKKK